MGPAGRLVTIKRSGGDGAHFPLSLSTCLFGRGVECDIRIQLPVVSRQHCKIEVHQQKAVLFNFSSANPTQVNGSVIDGPVQLKHGDVITVIDRSFRYEDDRHQSGSTSAESPGQRHGQAPRRVSRSSSSSDPDDEVEGHGAARSPLTEEGVSEESLAHTEGVRAARAVPRSSSRGPAARSPTNGHRSDFLGDDRRNTAGPLAGSPGQGSRGTLVSRNAGPESVPSPWCLERGGEKDSPFRKLYESMKEKLDVKSEKENVLQNRRKSESRSHCAGDSESVGGTWGETPLQGSPKSRRKSWLGSQTKAVPALGQREEERTGEGPGPTLEASASPSVPPTDTMRGSTPGRGSQRNSLRKRRSGGGSGVHGAEPVNPEQTALCTPKEPFPEHGTPTGGESAHSFGDTPEKIFSRKRRSSLPPKVDIPATETEITKPAVLVHVERKVPGSSLGPPRPMGAAAAPPGLSPTDVSNWDESIHEMEGVPLKTRRVSFGGHLRPELFDENLPPNTPLKRGETPVKRRSLVTHAPAVLKKIIKGQPQGSGKEGSSEARLEATPQNRFVSSPACHPTKSSSVAKDGRRRSSKAPALSGSQSPPQTEVPKRSGRRSSGAPSRGAPSGRGQQGLLQAIQSRRRSGASEANLIVAKSWADIVKLSAKQTQAKAVKHGPPRRPSKRQRRANTPKKPTGCVYNEFSTGHANSPCTIVVGKAHVQKVAAPARPYRMPNNFVFNKKIDFSEDLSGLTEMFKTPAKEKPKKMSLRLTAFSNSEDVFGKQFQVPEAEEKPQLCTPAKFGESVFPSAENAPEEPSDKKSASPALRKERMPVNENMLTPPSETEPLRAASRVKKSRRSVGLRNTQESGTECEKEDPEFDTVESILGRCLRTSPAQEQLLEGEMEGSERAFATCKRNFESKENSEKKVVMRRSRTPSELKCAQRTDVITTKRLQETESKEGLVGIHCFLQTPGCAEAPVGMENKATMRCCRSPTPEPVSTLSKTNVWMKTPSQRVSAEAPPVLRKPTQTPGDTEHTHKEAAGGDESMKASKKFPEQQQHSADHVTGSRRRTRTPKKKAQPVEDLADFKELFQTPNHTDEPMTDDKIMKMPSKSPKPEPISTPTSTKRRLRTPLEKVDVEEELSALRESTPTPGETTHSPGDPEGDAEDTRALKGTPEQKLDSAEHATGRRRRRSRTPKKKVQPTEDLTGFKDLFQTPNHVVETVTNDETTKVPSKSPKPEPVGTLSKMNVWIKTPSQRVSAEAPSALRKLIQTPGDTKHTHKEAVGGDESMKSNKFSDQQQDLAEHVTRSRRRSRTLKKKAQCVEDLTGFKELFQTPNHIVEPVTDDKIMKIPSKSPKPEPISTPTSTKRRLRTPLGKVDLEEELSALGEPTPTAGETTHSPGEPGGEEDIRALKGTPEQKQGSAEPVPGRRSRSRTPKREVQPTEDLTGFKELFQTPNHIVEPETDNKTMKTFSKSPKPEPVSTPTSTKRRLRTPLGKVDVEEVFLALGEPTQTSVETTHSPGDPEGDAEDIMALKGTPEQKLDSAEHVTRSRRRSRTPKRKVEPTEDLTGFKELFQTPNHIVEPVTENKTMKTFSKSPKPEPVSRPSSTKRRLRTILGKVDVEEELLALGEPTPTAGETTHSPGEPGGEEDIRASKGTPEQKQGSAEPITGRRSRSRTPKKKVQPTEDLTGFKELFQTPNHIDEPMTDDKTMKISSKSPNPEPIGTPTSTKRRLRTPLGKVDLEEFSGPRKPTQTSGNITCSLRHPEGDAEDIRALKVTPDQKKGLAEHVIGSRRRSRTPKREVQLMEDLTSFKDLFQTPNHVVETVTNDETTKVPSKSPKPERISTPTSTKRHLRTPLEKVDLEEAFLALGEPTQTSVETTHSPGDPEGDAEDIMALKGTPEQKLDSAEHVTRSRRRSRTPKRKVEPTEDLTGFKELFQTPNHTDEPMTENKTMKIPSKSPNPEQISIPTSIKRRLRTPLGKVDVEEALSALGEPTPTAGETTHSPGEPGGEEDIRASKGTPEHKQGSAEPITGRRSRSRTPKREVQLTEDLTGFKDLFQTPNHIVEPETDDKTMKTFSKSPKPEPVSRPSSTKRRLRTPLGKVDVEEGLSALRESTPTPGETTHSPGDPEGDAEDIMALKGTPEQKLDSAEHVTRSRRRSRTPKRKVEPTEDLTGFKELFQTPNHTDEPMTDDKTMKIPSKSPKPEQISTPTSTKRRLRTPLGKVDVEEALSALGEPTPTAGETTHSPGEPGGEEDIRASKGTPEQKWDSAEHISGSRGRSRTATRVNQPIEDLTGFKELFQTPRYTVESMSEDKATKMPCKSAQAKPAVMPTDRNRQLKAPPGKAVMKGELSVLQGSTRTLRKITRSHREPQGGDDDMELFKESREQKLLPEENVTAGKRRLRTRKEEAQFPADLANVNELLQIPSHTEDPVAVAHSTEVPSGSPQAEAVVMPPRTRRQLKAPPGTMAVQEESSAFGRPRGASGKTTRSHREPEGADKDMKLFKESSEQKLLPAENVTASKRRLRTRKEKAQFPADPASLKELLQVPNHTEDPVAVAHSTEMPSGSPQAEAVIMPARTRRQLKAPPGAVAVQGEPSALRRPRGTSGRATRFHGEPVDGAKDIQVCKGPPKREPGPVGNTVGSERLLRSRKGKAQPLHSPANSKQFLQSPAEDKELGTDTAGVMRTSTQTPDQSKPVTTSRRALRALNMKPTEELVDSRGPAKSQSESSAALSPKRKREDGSCMGPGRLRPRTRAQDTADEKPPQKRQRTAPREQCAPPELKKRQRVLREGIEPVDNLPSTNGKTKNKGRKEDVTSPNKEVSLCSSLPSKTKAAGQKPELLISAGKVQRKQDEKKPVKSSQEVEIQNLEGGAQNSAPGVKVHKRRMSPRPGRRGKVPVPSGAEEKAPASSVETHRKEEKGAPRSGFICLRSRKVTVPATGDTSESPSKQRVTRVTRSAKRPVQDADKENDNKCVKKTRTRSHRGQ